MQAILNLFENAHPPEFKTLEFQNLFIFSTSQVPKQSMLFNNLIRCPLKLKT